MSEAFAGDCRVQDAHGPVKPSCRRKDKPANDEEISEAFAPEQTSVNMGK